VGTLRRALIGAVAMALLAVPATAAADHGDGDRDRDGEDQRPEIWRAPSVSGVAQVGERLRAHGAAWSGRSPLTVRYFWLRCDGISLWDCSVDDAVESTSYLVSSGDVGKRLRAVVLVSNRDGTAYAWSEPTAAVTAAPPPPPPPPLETEPPTPAITPPAPVAEPPQSPTPGTPAPRVQRRPRMMRPAPLVRIAGWLTGRGAMVTRLTVSAPRGASIAVRCQGRGCPRRSLAMATTITRLRLFERPLPGGTRLVIRVTRPGFIGKHTVLRIRRGKAPARRDRCLYPGSEAPVKCPSG
jgi:hypothetical protein